METFVIGKDLLQAIGNYLCGRPYGEVAGMIKAIEHLQPCKVAPVTDDNAPLLKIMGGVEGDSGHAPANA